LSSRRITFDLKSDALLVFPDALMSSLSRPAAMIVEVDEQFKLGKAQPSAGYRTTPAASAQLKSVSANDIGS
jgi:hypothetical protein